MRTLTAIIALVLVGCAGSAPPHTQYLLRGEPTERTGRVDAPVRVGLGRVSVAPYLDRSGVVVETEAGQVRAARQHEWAEPLDAGLRSLLRAQVSDALGYEVSARAGQGAPWDFAVDVHVERLHGTMSGTALLEAGYWIKPRPGAGEAIEYRFSRATPLPREGYPGLVDAEAELARELARAIAASVRELVAARSSP